VRLVWYHVHPTRWDAIQAEHRLKRGRTRQKTIDLMIKSFPKVALEAMELQERAIGGKAAGAMSNMRIS
jgi:predicted GIY-YIG superfamily endonuclease